MLIILCLVMLLPIAIIYGFYTLILSAFYKMKINSLLENINTKEDIYDINHKDFINVALEIFIRKGFKAEITSKCGEEGNAHNSREF